MPEVDISLGQSYGRKIGFCIGSTVIDRASSIRCLAKSKHAVPVQVLVTFDKGKVICQVDARYAVEAILNCSPELNYKSDVEFSVYALDHLEADELFVGLGFLSSLSSQSIPGPSKSFPTETIWLNGRVVETGLQRSLEIRLRLQAVPSSTSSKVHNEALPPSLILDNSSSDQSDSTSFFDSAYSSANLATLPNPESDLYPSPVPLSSRFTDPPSESLEFDSIYPQDNTQNDYPAAPFSEPYSMEPPSSNIHPATDPVCPSTSIAESISNAASKKKRKREASAVPFNASNLSVPSEREHVQDFIKEQVRIARARIEKRLPTIRGKDRIEEQLSNSLREGKIPPYCQNCGAIKTANWRNANFMNTTIMLCNACGIYWTTRHSMRPKSLWSTYKNLEVEKPSELDSFAQLEIAVYKLSQQKKPLIPVFRQLETAGRHSPLPKVNPKSSGSATESRTSSTNVGLEERPPASLLNNDLRRIQSSPITKTTNENVRESLREPLSEIGTNSSWLVLPSAANDNIQRSNSEKLMSSNPNKENENRLPKQHLRQVIRKPDEDAEPTLPVCDLDKDVDDQLESLFKTPPKPKKAKQSPSPWRSELFLSDLDQITLTPEIKPKFDLSKALAAAVKADNKENSPHLPENTESVELFPEFMQSPLADADERRTISLTTDLAMPSSPPMAPIDRFIS
ncbi:cell cycle regulated GATA-type transcription factor Ams2 [Schizosaccharomyces cryophilus OY26]|uniref:Cell cycle regulated GATA-type transcription factor Ams2 n=1 Tax=Schizosaccharomyces cryophilus (strain OY26 / ATCC MYA-4695 / CBS 11777 / NBRC 106824 / NRRL Y48691) TaxID=653667 RepID=S9VTL4_SCHCR|nr:cell cycle regulated GATA-type transcription factor Ams2 [Schizosaccharomyces cryophilus OY26]EPY51218.1 cell cycle regulated GATA-type transcription factor Ams2 [Schizosaccharomyces cryophilus OY26]